MGCIYKDSCLIQKEYIYTIYMHTLNGHTLPAYVSTIPTKYQALWQGSLFERRLLDRSIF